MLWQNWCIGQAAVESSPILSLSLQARLRSPIAHLKEAAMMQNTHISSPIHGWGMLRKKTNLAGSVQQRAIATPIPPKWRFNDHKNRFYCICIWWYLSNRCTRQWEPQVVPIAVCPHITAITHLLCVQDLRSIMGTWAQCGDSSEQKWAYGSSSRAGQTEPPPLSCLQNLSGFRWNSSVVFYHPVAWQWF